MSDVMAVLQHGTAVDVSGRGVLILGRGGAGKSSLALQLMAYGARLVADDQVRLIREGPDIIARPAPNLDGMIEARGIGLLRADHVAQTVLALVVDLDQTETARLPEPRIHTYFGKALPLLRNVPNPAFPAAILQYIKTGRVSV